MGNEHMYPLVLRGGGGGGEDLTTDQKRPSLKVLKTYTVP